MPPLNLTQLAIGERVQHELLVVERVEKTQGNGDPFVLLTLGNASASIGVAPIWSNQREWADGADRGRVVQAIGQVGLYPKTGKRQIHLAGPLRVLPTEQVDLHAFLPRIAWAPRGSGTGSTGVAPRCPRPPSGGSWISSTRTTAFVSGSNRLPAR